MTWTTVPRFETVGKIVDILEQTNFVHIRGTPASGKSTLLQLVGLYLSQQGTHVCSVTRWRQQTDISSNPQGWIQYLSAAAGMPDNQDAIRLRASNTVILIDEGQTAYSDESFWNDCVKWIIGLPSSALRIVLAAGYGSLTADEDAVTPVRIRRESVIEIFHDNPIHPGNSPHPGIYFNIDEFEQLFAANERYYSVTFTQAFRDKVWKLTGGHTGAVADLLYHARKTSVCSPHSRFVWIVGSNRSLGRTAKQAPWRAD